MTNAHDSNGSEITPSTTSTGTPLVRKAMMAAAGLVGLATIGLIAPSVAAAQSADAETPPVVELEDAEPRSSAILDQLVEEGQLTQEQADAISERFEERQNERRGHRAEHRGDRGAAIAELLGLTTDELREQVGAGSTLAEVAEANGVDRETLVATIVEAKSAHIEEHLAAGDITAEEAAERQAGLQERVEEKVDSDPSERDGRRGNRGARGFAPTGGGQPA